MLLLLLLTLEIDRLNKMNRSDAELSLMGDNYHPGFSVDCVIIAFQEGTLKILLNKFNVDEKWGLPGGFVYKDENVEDAAYRLLVNRTGLKDIFLRQFYLFGDANRNPLEEHRKELKSRNISEADGKWFLNRFITVGYYALVQYDKVKPYADPQDEQVAWFSIERIPTLKKDHNHIIEKALESIRYQLGYIPIGYELLPDKFTMPELRVIYEAIIGQPLDRRNFQRKMLSIGLIRKLNETRPSGAHKSPLLYEFNKDKYEEALKNGMQLMDWRMS